MKRIVSIFLAVLILSSACLGAVLTVRAQEPNQTGDVNGDGAINLQDVVSIQKYLAKIIPESEIDMTAADTDGVGGVNMQDVLLI